MTTYETKDISGMIVALAVYRIGMIDLVFAEHEKEDEALRDKTLQFVSELLGPKIVHKVDQAEAKLREKAQEKRNPNGQ